MRKISYKNISIKDFFEVMDHPEKLEEVLPGITEEQWKEAKRDFQESNLSDEQELTLEMQHEAMVPSAKLQLYSMLSQFSLLAPEKWKTFFDEAGVTRKATLVDSLKSLESKIKKEKVRLNVSSAELENYIENLGDIDDAEENYDIFDVLSSLGAVTGNRLDYSTSTMGEFLAEQRLAKRITEAKANDTQNGQG